MGRHARGATRLRVSLSTVVLGTLIVTVVAVGSLLSSRAQPTPIAAEGVEGTAVVVSSLACQNGAGGTLVDVLSPAGLPGGTEVRANLDACGYQEGEQLVVQFPASDPTQVSLLGSAAADTVTGGRLLPYGLLLAALLAAGAAAAVWVDARRSRRARAFAAVHVVDTENTPQTEAPEADASETSWSADPFGALGETMLLPPTELHGLGEPHGPSAPRGRAESHRPSGRHARPETDWGEGNSPDPASAASPRLLVTPQPITAIEPDEIFDRAPSVDRALSTVDLAFPFTASLADSLHDELFTHRTVWS
jgi:hypothetical protein